MSSLKSFSGQNFVVNDEVQDSFKENGFVLVKGLMTPEEIASLKNFFETETAIQSNAFGREDNMGAKNKLVVWNYARQDMAGTIARSDKIAGNLEQLLGGDELYHYHSKLIMKEGKTGGAVIWHQDYGYWYENGCLLPEMGTVFIPIDSCTSSNGCLQILPGSHRLGRLNHSKQGTLKTQAGIEPERLRWAETMFPKADVIMEPGDVLFFNCNLVHGSGQNCSDDRRWAFIVSYNKRKNDSFKLHHFPQYHELKRARDSEILEASGRKMDEQACQFMKATDKRVQ